MDVSKETDKKEPMYFVNPEITWKSNTNATYEEGCLSIPNQFAKIERPDKCKVKYLDFDGVEKEIKAEGLLATCIQHEMDHLNGIVFLDHLSRLKRQMALKKLKKATQGASV